MWGPRGPDAAAPNAHVPSSPLLFPFSLIGPVLLDALEFFYHITKKKKENKILIEFSVQSNATPFISVNLFSLQKKKKAEGFSKKKKKQTALNLSHLHF